MATFALTGARLLDGSRPALDDATVVVDGDRITEVGTGAPGAPVDRTFDLAGRTLLPGMFTCHFHATYHELGSQPNLPYGDEYPPSYLALIAARNLATALRLGFRNCSSPRIRAASCTRWSISDFFSFRSLSPNAMFS
jgi:imidazolonepropionase-like amidohydrolase